MDYLTLKWLHILSSVLLVGTGFGSAFYLFWTNRSGSLPAIAVISRLVVRADWWFTAPTAILQPLSGIWLARRAGFPLESGWVLASLVLYAMAGACWLPVVWLQIRMAEMAASALARGEALPRRYWQYARLWTALGIPAFIAMLAIYWLMVEKPDLPGF